MPMIAFKCPCCGRVEDQFLHPRNIHAGMTRECEGVILPEPEIRKEKVEIRINNPDGTQTIEYEEIELELAPAMTICTGTMTQCSLMEVPRYGSRNARGFEPLVVYERVGELSRGQQRYYVPGRNNEPTEPGMKRVELTNMAEYNRFVKTANEYETGKMRDHREMHRFYWDSRRKAMRDHVDSRIRHSPLLVSLARLVRARSDRKSNARYGKPLDAHFHSQLMEFNQGNIQDFCAEDTGWKATRAR